MFDRVKFITQFKAEVSERLQRLNLGLLKLEKQPQDKELLEGLMREAHTIKGSASMMGYKRVAELAHKMEDGLERLLKQEVKLEKKHVDVLFKCIDSIEPLLEDKLTWEDKGVARPYVEELCAEVEAVFQGKVKKAAVTKPLPSPQAPASDEESIRVSTENLDKLMNLSGELLISKIRLSELVKGLAVSQGPQTAELKTASETINFLASGVQDEVINLRMVPVFYLFNLFPRMVRDLSVQQGKVVDLETKGEHTRLDKKIIDEMKDPLMHLLRNAIDHGIESPAERKKLQKPERATITLNSYSQGSQVAIEVSDDGRGIDINKVKEQAKAKGLVSAEKLKNMPDEQIIQFIFSPEFSTKEDVTEVSGRGVGLKVVKESITNLKGTLEVVSQPGKGTKFIMKLPLTLAIRESLLVVSGEDMFALPIEAVVETLRISQQEIHTVETKEAITVRGQILPLVRLANILGLPQRGIMEKKFFSVVILQSAEKRSALLVDELRGRQEIVHKAIPEPLKNIKYFSGTTILGNGRVVLILEAASIMDAGQYEGSRPALLKPIAAGKKRKTVLLVEDVLSTAMLEKNILESAGLSVVIARDGKEALEKAQQEKFDLVITDILMPRMDGFELTGKLKQDKLYQDIPVVILTTRESDADKRHGLEAGADAYLVKSEFTSEGLLETIGRLIG